MRQHQYTNNSGRTHCSCSWRLYVLLLFCVSSVWADTPENLENKLKTAYLVNFAKFTTWDAPIEQKVICVFQSAAIYPEIKQLQDIVHQVDNDVSIMIDPHELTECQLLYWDESTQEQLSEELLLTLHPALLIVSDMNDAHDQGFAIQFFVRNLKLRFAINREVVRNSEYRISSKLQRLSRQIE